VSSIGLLLAGALSARIGVSQITRDRAARARLLHAVEDVEGLRRKVGHLPSNDELVHEGPQWIDFTIYERFIDSPQRLRELGATNERDYTLAFRRSEDYDHFYSWSGEDTCDSGAWYLILLFSVPTAALGLLLGWLAFTSKEASPAQRPH
jgi:hypothetical protein